MIYVMSDIHGNLDRFESVMNQIDLRPEDTLYVLGDVVDRFPHGIEILQRIMKMPNAQMLLGNHEYMMLDVVDGPYSLTTFEKRESYSRRQRVWYNNGGRVTHEAFDALSEREKRQVIAYLNNLPVNLNVVVNGINYRLVHGAPIEMYQEWGQNYDTLEEFAVWCRWHAKYPVPDDCVMIFGHTPTVHYQEKMPFEVWQRPDRIGIDCGAGYAADRDPYCACRLACIRLDDMKVFYSEEGR